MSVLLTRLGASRLRCCIIIADPGVLRHKWNFPENQRSVTRYQPSYPTGRIVPKIIENVTKASTKRNLDRSLNTCTRRLKGHLRNAGEKGRWKTKPARGCWEKGARGRLGRRVQAWSWTQLWVQARGRTAHTRCGPRVCSRWGCHRVTPGTARWSTCASAPENTRSALYFKRH